MTIPFLFRARLIMACSVLGFAAVVLIAALSAQKIYTASSQGATTADPAAFRAAATPCFTLRGGAQADCYTRVAEELLAHASAREVLDSLAQLEQDDRQFLLQCHPIAHAIGRQVYRNEGRVDRAFAACDQTCHSGCFHGVMERVFLGEDAGKVELHAVSRQDIAEKIPHVCDSPIFSHTTGNLEFQCLHGLGHAMLFFSDYNLPAALFLCDLLGTDWQRGSCYGGVVMENITAFDKSKRALNSDPQFPCNAILQRYRPACWIMQTSWLVEQGFSWEKIGNVCRQAGEWRLACFQSLGRDLSNEARVNATTAVPACAVLPHDEQEACMNGTINALLDNTWDGRYAFPFCDGFLAPAAHASCYHHAVRYLSQFLFISPEAIKVSCRTYARDQGLCLSSE